MSYGQFCPIAKAMEILGEKWTLLIVRELLMGSTRFNDFQRGLPQISPTLLSKRLHSLGDNGILVKRRAPNQKSFEYHPTESCRELMAVMERIGAWGMRWARSMLNEDDFDIELLMLYLQRSVQPDKLVGRETVIRFNFTDLEEFKTWWIVVSGDDVDICVHDPKKEVDVYFNVDLRTMCELWMGDISYKKALADNRLQLLGLPALTRNVSDWLKCSIFAGIPSAIAITEPA